MDNILKSLRDYEPFIYEEKHLLKTTGDVKQKYEVLGIVTGVSLKAYEEVQSFIDYVYKRKKIDYNLIEGGHNQALLVMEREAIKMDADAIINISIKSIDLLGELIEFLCYGTAIKYIE